MAFPTSMVKIWANFEFGAPKPELWRIYSEYLQLYSFLKLKNLFESTRGHNSELWVQHEITSNPYYGHI